MQNARMQTGYDQQFGPCSTLLLKKALWTSRHASLICKEDFVERSHHLSGSKLHLWQLEKVAIKVNLYEALFVCHVYYRFR